MHLFDILPAISSRKVGAFFCLESCNLALCVICSGEAEDISDIHEGNRTDRQHPHRSVLHHEPHLFRIRKFLA